ncbi:TIGR00341 family protein [Methanosalsum natronophilum]|uniref:TIGR00341 family protein n=1 Tax=Methanosalsum natronophilum TaxID=768733 RepID=UPI002167F9ED|nr:TIGR00341 family protein [Methanosalsum natronophilum]MCS3924613.1 putative hydrophobic protein (TIGR00341 family) [Methanosalsum natronophilum]
MATRLIEVFLPAEKKERVEELLDKNRYIDAWYSDLDDEKMLVRVLTLAENTQKVVDDFVNWFSLSDGFRIIIHSIDATIPLAEQAENDENEVANNQLLVDANEENKPKEIKYGSITREELYEEISKNTSWRIDYFVLIILSSIVAVIGVLEDSTAIIIGAMVIAPLLGPNIALSLATTLADVDLGIKSMKVNFLGIGIAILISISVGMVTVVDPGITEIATRTSVNLGYVILGLAAGGAGALAITTGVSTAIVGVMVAVALLPPLVVFGLLVGAGHLNLAYGAMLLFLVNLIAINLSGVITFYAQGVRPSNWWDIKEAKRTTFHAMFMWFVLLLILISLMYLSPN